MPTSLRSSHREEGKDTISKASAHPRQEVTVSKRETEARDKAVLQTLRDLYEDAGGRLSGAPTSPNGWEAPSVDGSLTLTFDYGSPRVLRTPSGRYPFASGSTIISHRGREKFLQSLAEVFDILEVVPQRDDSGVPATPRPISTCPAVLFSN